MSLQWGNSQIPRLARPESEMPIFPLAMGQGEGKMVPLAISL